MSSRQKLKATNDIFEMISENDEDIKFDECGILKPVTVSKSTIVVVSILISNLFSIHIFRSSQLMIFLIHLHLKQHQYVMVIVCIISKMR
jgi:hypothetical protein